MAGILEVCADSMESALAAERGGADRIELCGNLVIGGTTPSQALFEKIRKETSLKIRVLLRPRFGDFCYSQNEYEILKEEVKLPDKILLFDDIYTTGKTIRLSAKLLQYKGIEDVKLFTEFR